MFSLNVVTHILMCCMCMIDYVYWIKWYDYSNLTYVNKWF